MNVLFRIGSPIPSWKLESIELINSDEFWGNGEHHTIRLNHSAILPLSIIWCVYFIYIYIFILCIRFLLSSMRISKCIYTIFVHRCRMIFPLQSLHYSLLPFVSHRYPVIQESPVTSSKNRKPSVTLTRFGYVCLKLGFWTKAGIFGWLRYEPLKQRRRWALTHMS